MPRLDAIHDAVKNALVKDGWIITADPYYIKYEEIKIWADLAAERPFAAEREGRKIMVEIKSFLSPSPVSELERALGQYRLYSKILALTEPERELYLAISSEAHKQFFSRKGVKDVLQDEQLAMVIVDIETEEVRQWIE